MNLKTTRARRPRKIRSSNPPDEIPKALTIDDSKSKKEDPVFNPSDNDEVVI
jgi:hypothetical protein